MGFAIPAKNVHELVVPLQVWAASLDDLVPYEANVQPWVETQSPSFTTKVVRGAGHMSFLPACSPGRPDSNPAIAEVCTDPPGFDRRQFKEEFNREVVQHFQNALPRR
jgi:predicted dienelactone hydrolase